MLDVDIIQFWKDDAVAHRNNCFSREAVQTAFGIRMNDNCVFAELGEEGNPWGFTPLEHRMELNKRYNDKSEKIVGKRLLKENYPEPKAEFPDIKGIGEVFGGRYYFNGHTTWLERSCETPYELEKILDRVEKTDLRRFILPPDWEAEKRRIYERTGRKPRIWRSVRGPVTLAMSIYGIENTIYLINDEPDLAARFSRIIGDVISGYAAIMDEEAGYKPNAGAVDGISCSDCTQSPAPGGFWFSDDNCCMLTPKMYEFFAYPILEKIFNCWSPKPADARYQHSDSDMGHLLPVLSKLNFSGVNFGPKVMFGDIRKYMPHTCIDGCIAPFTFMSNDKTAIINEVKRDCEAAKQTRGLNVTTAGSINNGSLLTSMRAAMYAIQTYGRY